MGFSMHTSRSIIISNANFKDVCNSIFCHFCNTECKILSLSIIVHPIEVASHARAPASLLY